MAAPILCFFPLLLLLLLLLLLQRLVSAKKKRTAGSGSSSSVFRVRVTVDAPCAVVAGAYSSEESPLGGTGARCC